MPEENLSIIPANPFPTRSESLVLKAESLLNNGSDEKLSAPERQDALAVLMSARPDMSNVDLARFFKVNEKSIRTDKEVIRKRLSEELGDRDVALVISDLIHGHNRRMTELAASRKKCAYGTNTWLAHWKAEKDAEKEIIELLQSLGVYPKNLGNLQKTEFVFKAHVAKGGGVNVVSIQSREELKTIEAREEKLLPGAFVTLEDDAIRSQFDEQFSETPKEPSSGTP